MNRFKPYPPGATVAEKIATIRPPKGWFDPPPVEPPFMGGFRMFESYVKAVAYAETFKYHVLSFDPVVSRWTVEPLDHNYI